jgi:hypothetical protein
MVIKANKDPDFKGVELDGKRYKFGNDNWFRVPGDPGLANALRQKVGMNATVTRVRYPKPADRGHKYFFQTPRLPWHHYDSEGNRIKE